MLKNTTYNITLDKSLFVDHTFEKVKRFTEFFPIKYETIIDGKFDRLNASSRLLLVRLISLCYKQMSPIVQVNDIDLPHFRKVNTQLMLLELSNSGYLQTPIKKEIKKESIYSEISNEKNSFSEKENKITDRSSTANFNSRFDSDVPKWISVLDEFGLKKKMDMYIGQLKSSFNSSEDLKIFINELSNSKGCKEIISSNTEEKTKMFRIEKYTLTALKTEIGVIKK